MVGEIFDYSKHGVPEGKGSTQTRRNESQCMYTASSD